MARLEDAFYLDDYQDGVSSLILETADISLYRKNIEYISAKFSSGINSVLDSHLIGTELISKEEIGVAAVDGDVIVDFRDSGDAWVRLVLRDGDSIVVGRGKHFRFSNPYDNGFVYVPYQYEENPDRYSRVNTVVFSAPCDNITKCGTFQIFTNSDFSSAYEIRYPKNDKAKYESLLPYFERPGNPNVRDVVVDLCNGFFTLGWVTGTGGSISIRSGDRIFMAPSGVQKERMQRQDIFTLDLNSKEIYIPRPIRGRAQLKLSQCAPLFHCAFTDRKAGACIHTHDINAVLVTLLEKDKKSFKITHQEMIKGIAGHEFNSMCEIPIIENTPHERDLETSLRQAMRDYPNSNAVLVRRHGVYVWGSSWESAKTQAECYHYLFEVAVRMRGIGLDPAEIPKVFTEGIGSNYAYGSGNERASTYNSLSLDAGRILNLASADTETASMSGSDAKEEKGRFSGCCTSGIACESTSCSSSSKEDAAEAVSSGFHGSAGTSSLRVSQELLSSVGAAATTLGNSPLPHSNSFSHVLLDVEGATTSISFVLDTLFPYSKQNTPGYLTSGAASVLEDVRNLIAQSAADSSANVAGVKDLSFILGGATPDTLSHDMVTANLSSIVEYVNYNIDNNRKIGALKTLQGNIWKSGYESGTLVAHMFEDTPFALKKWTENGKKVYIYSSGSRDAQRLLFKYSSVPSSFKKEVGGEEATGSYDLRRFISGYFDTAVGPKVESSSYSDIVKSVGVDHASQILFCTDSLAEAVAAKKAGIQVVLTDRPGNVPIVEKHSFPVAKRLIDLA